MTPAKGNRHSKRNGGGPAEETKNPRQGDQGRFPVVGIGASAGGLEAFSAFLKALPSDLGMAFILIPHLDPSRESAFTQILARVTTMEVLTVAEGMRLEPNHVYIIPPNCDLTISSSVLHISNREEPRVGNTTIDIFMRSLASDQGGNAIGIILSGTGADGTSGLTAIKGEGGITFAQDSQSAKYDGMPANATIAGCVDFVLPPERIAQELARISQHPYLAGADTMPIEEDKSAESYMAQVFRILRRATKVDFSEYKPPTIGRRIKRRMVLHKIEQLSDYGRCCTATAWR